MSAVAIIGEPNVLALDIGGTTAKCSLIENGHVKIMTDYWIERSRRSSGYPIMVRHNVKDVVILVCSPDGKYAWLEDASWTAGVVDHKWYLTNPPTPAEFTMDPDQKSKP